MSLFGKKERLIVIDGLWNKNPISFLVMGICSALAVTVKMQTALIMALGTTFVLSFGCMAVALIRNYIPSNIRIIVQILVVSVLVIMVDQVLRAFFFDLSKQISVFIGLIITNTLVLGRTEGYAMNNPPWPSFLDGLGNALGYSSFLLMISALREIFGSGTFFGFPVVPHFFYQAGYINNSIMVLAPGAFFLLGALVCIHRMITGHREEH
ncbi:MAG: NADH:ubiquinone reductase (Na(+)-transporting) subunit D [Candidatus Omnitrophica bacterium]|nr:NADH:ubiquinone reductase (Na(+)-transporting) subunit D [Candidatus Omnitrophota bacterium]